MISANCKIEAKDLPLGPGVRLISTNMHGLVAVDKPAGLMSHPNKPGDVSRSLLTAEYNYEGEFYSWKINGSEQRVWLINRLDSPTSGLLLLALNAEMNKIIKRLFSTHSVRKTYYALVRQSPLPAVGMWKDLLKEDIYYKIKRTKVGQRLLAHTNYEVVNESAKGRQIVLLKLMPITGRTHQLRIQCKNHKHPIVGDRTYGDFGFNRKIASATGQKRLMLHSAEIAVHYSYQGNKYDFYAKSALPDAFAKILQFNAGMSPRST